MQDTQDSSRVTTPRKRKTPICRVPEPKPKRTTWTIDPDEISETLVERAMKARPGVSRTRIILELIKNGLKQFAGKKEQA